MEFLFTSYNPFKFSERTFSDAFYDMVSRSSKIDIAVGYVSADSLAALQKTVELNANIEQLNLIIGMHKFDGFTRVQYSAALGLNEYLASESRGGVSLVKAFKYHGKLYSFSGIEGPFAGIIGSDNLGSIAGGGTRLWEASVLLDDKQSALRMNSFISELAEKASENIAGAEIAEFIDARSPLEGQEHAEKASPREVADAMSRVRQDAVFKIPIKTSEEAPKSNLNVFFGKGRESKNGVVIPRHWYEAELIVPKKITSLPGYPQSNTDGAVFSVITDDGWKFKCKVSGQNSKNFRSEGDLRILGKWIKGRLENAGVLKVGEPVAAETLKNYGRPDFTLSQTETPGLWYLDFGVK